MKISITRSFSKKVQLKQFEPIDVFCAATIEEDGFSAMEIIAKDKKGLEDFVLYQRNMSEALDELCRQEVEKTLAIVRPPLVKPTTEKSNTKARKVENKEVAKESVELDAGNEE